ncbi:isochorismatase family protein [Zymomonas mobilis]|uniref:Isochorismatase hydrolase n=1 Tax=Zymomonas mobilis subsp. pomaceae (strain ATCC 29192 / DSM 22645 / JCM 10191 / CCUG 17912 / NBRC 13757 / NCIMB 11200 / NRRL B-4491 / Barker I) TaxID=579138 RepID=F8EVR2_ZYMMT|nr:isochorismatase family protein [Zymomonas mobilis]AEI38399.1 isochorismatase hydrolase [Zymomonas mobilis subsp. pomaceae ATCC 29192]MDX5948089.1 isochorismatase family protein [Zymomonas mobilis subsp. pomaceae]GEB89418.1 hydrolase [Zymomonas mobilis subsp. pomaceae]
MTVTTLDPKTALILIDLQKGILSYPTVHPTEEVVKRSRALAEAFRRHNLPVVLVNVAGVSPVRTEQSFKQDPLPEGWTELTPELNGQPSDYRVTKYTWGAFTHTDLEAYLRKYGITQVVIAGVATSFGVESTARSAYELGFNITLAIDAMTDMTLEAHNNSLTRIFPRLGETGQTTEIIALLDKRLKQA